MNRAWTILIVVLVAVFLLWAATVAFQDRRHHRTGSADLDMRDRHPRPPGVCPCGSRTCPRSTPPE